ncbi:MAG: hypothetical protein ACLSAO_07135 [Anaerovoracaceae bacterium]
MTINTSERRQKSYLGICAAALLVSLVLLLITAFAAFTFYTADEKMSASKQKMKYSQSYYAAETTASEIINEFYEEKNQVSANLNGRENYEAIQGNIEVTKIDARIYFSVPVDNSTSLEVEAKVTKNDIEIIKWFTK